MSRRVGIQPARRFSAAGCGAQAPRRMNPALRGGALLAVLWLAAALSAIVFSVSTTVRGETERTATGVEGVRAYYLATGSIDRAVLYMQWGGGLRKPDGKPRYWEAGIPALHFEYAGGDTLVEIIPETSRLDINEAKPDELQRLLLALGAEPERAAEIAAAILDWRKPAPPGSTGPFDFFYLGRTPSFPARHASIEEIEEVLLVKGMTPELFYGGYERDGEGRLVPRAGLRDCLSVYGSGTSFDVNTVEPALLAAVGMSPDLIRLIVETRHRTPFRRLEEVRELAGGPAPGLNRLAFNNCSIFTLRATARPRTASGKPSDLLRTVAATVKFADQDPPLTVLRWYDNAPTPARTF